MIFSEALGRLEGLGRSAAALVPGLVIALVLFGIGLLVARGVRATVRRAAETARGLARLGPRCSGASPAA